MMLNFQFRSQYIHSSKEVNFICVLLKITRPRRPFLNIEISYSNNIRFKILGFYCINFVFGPSIFIKALNEINLIKIKLQTNCQSSEASVFRTQNIKTLKTVFNSLTSVKIFYTPLGHITQNISTKNFVRIPPDWKKKSCKK